jgi:UDPglucose--hexose-1-phosphate uridylyltransferase
MSRFRQNPITGDWIVLAPERSERPNAFLDDAREPGPGQCPFCPGNEGMTPPEILRVGRDPWRLRLVPNKYPAVSTGSAFEANGALAAGSGHHEVLVESHEHGITIDRVRTEDVAAAVAICRDRYAKLTEADRGHVAIFKNHGRAAGASISHIHSQILSLPFVPQRIREETAGFARAPECPLCSPSAGDLIASGRHFRWIAPAFAASPYQQWIVPLEHAPNLGRLSDAAASELAELLQRSVRAMNGLSPELAFNWMFLNFHQPRCHWYVEIAPRLTTLAGFELGTASGIQIVDPARAARELREGM